MNASRESALDTCPLANRPGSSQSDGGGRRTTTQAPVSWGQARASGKTGAREQFGDDGWTRAPRCLPRAVDDTLTRGLRYVTGSRGMAVIRNMRGMIRSRAADGLEARVTRYE